MTENQASCVVPRLYDNLAQHLTSIRPKAEWASDESTVWHYTSLETALKIIDPQNSKGPALHVAPFSRMMDGSEGRWLGSNVATRVHDEALKRFLVHASVDAYATCFCVDSDLLSQWFLYGDGGHGVALGFQVDHLQQAAKSVSTPQFIKVVYKDDSDDFFDSAAKLVDELKTAAFKEPPERAGNMRYFWPG